MAIQMKAIEQYFHVVLIIMLCKVVLTLESVDEIPMTIQMKATEQHFPVVLFSILYKVMLLSCSLFAISLLGIAVKVLAFSCL